MGMKKKILLKLLEPEMKKSIKELKKSFRRIKFGKPEGLKPFI
jgi:ribosome recycling factor